MNLLRRLFLSTVCVLLALTAVVAPARADTGYFIIDGYSYPSRIVGGPYESYVVCSRIAAAYGGYPLHCEVRAY